MALLCRGFFRDLISPRKAMVHLFDDNFVPFSLLWYEIVSGDLSLELDMHQTDNDALKKVLPSCFNFRCDEIHSQ